MKGLSIRAYGRHRGVSEAAVRKAIKTGRITALPDGTIDPVAADRDWQQHTDQSQQRGKQATIAAVPESVESSHPPVAAGTTFLQAQTANEVIKAQTNKLRLAKLKGELIERKAVIAHVTGLARAEREAWLNWPARVSSVLAVDLGIEASALARVLEQAVHAHLSELGAVTVSLQT